jgi:hypothetical protein
MMIQLAACLALALFQAEDPGKGRLPVQVPEGWTGKRQEAAYVLTPKDLPAGKLYTVISADLVEKVGSLKGLLDAGKASLGESGKFTALRDPAPGSSVGGWNYEVVMGPLEKDGATLLAQVVAFRKGEDEGLLITVADSIETLTKYSDGFTAIVRNVGAPKAAPAPAVAAGKVDLRYKAPEGWVAKTLEQGVLLVEEKSDFYDKHSYRLMILPSEPLTGSLRAKFLEVWAAQIQPGIDTTIVPLPLMRRLKSGSVVAFDLDPSAKTKAGVAHHGGMYLLARGNRCVPILCFHFGLGDTKPLLAAVEPLLESAEIPGAGDAAISLFDAADLVGNWNTSSLSLANYVTAGGAYAGDASISTADYFHLNKDGTFTKTFIGITSTRRLKETMEGTWKLDDAGLLLTLKDPDAKPQLYRVFGVGGDAKGGNFLVLSNAANTDEQVDLCIARRMFSGTWYKRKD